MKKIILGMMLVMGSLSFSSDKGSSVKISNIFNNVKKEQTQKQETSQEQETPQDKLNTGNSMKLSNIFGKKPLDVNN